MQSTHPPCFSSLSTSHSQSMAHIHSKMWKSHSIPKYLAEDVDICKMLELVKEEEERMEKLKEEVEMTMLRLNSFVSWSTIVRMRGG